MTKAKQHETTELRSEQFVPYSIEAEDAVLGSVLINPEALDEVCWLERDDFFLEKNAWIWEAFQRLKARNEPLDYLTVVSELETSGRLVDVGGAAYVLSLINKTPSALNVEGYGRIVERMYCRRDLLDAAQVAARLAHSDELEIEEILRQTDNRFNEVFVRHAHKQSLFVTSHQAAGELWEDVVRWHAEPGVLRGMCTGLEYVDNLSRGFRRNKLYYLCARPGMGKSAFVARIARGLASNGYKVLIYALEMSAYEMIARMACQIANITWDDVEKGILSDEETERYKDAVLQVGELGIIFEETSGLTMQEYWDKTTAYEKEHGPLDFVIMDTINCTQGLGEGSTAQMTYSSRTAKNWAHDKKHRYALLCVAQLNRINESAVDKRPTLRAIRDSGAIEEDGDIIWGLFRPGYYDKGIEDSLLIAEVLKGRQYGAPVGSDIHLAWRGSCFGIEMPGTGTPQPPPQPFVQTTFAENSARHYDP